MHLSPWYSNAYLFITSRSGLVENYFKFNPKNIVIIGDSPGGNLALSLTIIPHELSGVSPDASIVIPGAAYQKYIH